MLLRVAIGWHFLYEGVEKIYSTPEGRSTYLARILPPPPQAPPMDKGEAPFSAEVYLRNASGPLAPYFRILVPDVEGREKLDPQRLKRSWGEELERFAAHYELTREQRTKAEEELRNREAIADDWFKDPDNARRIKKYFDDLGHYLHMERDPDLLASERKQAYEDRREIDSERRALIQVVDAWTGTLRDAWSKLIDEEQAERAGPLPTPWTRLDTINTLTKYGLTAVGLLLMLGLFTPLAALGGAAYLAMFYFSMPPWPGLPTSPMAEGHYLIVNKNLIEMLACLVLASIPTGLWIGLDALLFGWLGRGRRTEAPDSHDSDAPLGPAGPRQPETLTRSDR